jgi:2-C-methyl-D-erythritol 4-phosphate cytidylyltransferase
MPSFAAILPAAGNSSRFGGPTNKLFEVLDGRTVLERSVDAFRRRSDVTVIVVPARGPIAELTGDRILVCAGGATRAHSVWNALREVPTSVEWVAVHDAARPLVSQALIDRTLAAALEHGAAAVPALPVHLTIKQATGPLPARVERTIPRQTLWAMQTPQIARRQALLDAFENCPIPLEQVTDDVQLIELGGGEVWLVRGEERNLKITTPQDMQLAQAILTAKS